MNETPVVFVCGADELVAMVHRQGKDRHHNIGVLIVVGGPQYRVGSHRQFVTLARDLAGAGIAAMRFDYRGMGDSTGEQIAFEGAVPDIKAAIDTFMLHCPQLVHLVLWGLCDAASACLMYSVSDERVKGLVLANPWVRSEAGIAKTHLKHYYTSRFFEKEFWLKILKFDFDYVESFRSIIYQIRTLLFFKRKLIKNKNRVQLPFQKKMEIALSEFKGNVLFLISGNDLTAAEFKDMINSSKFWEKMIKAENIKRYELTNADHTFSRKQWKAEVSALTIKWLQKNFRR